jgi:peptidoglycan/LPS O-acetylase OafA/YrhL
VEANRYQHLDSIRGLAAFLVVWIHGSETFAKGLSPSMLTHLLFEIPDAMKIGRIGVVIFFALSGYLIAKSLEGRHAAIAFPIKRAFRLYPIYLFSIACVIVVLGGRFDLPTLLANATMVPTLFGKVEIMALFWTLQTEVIFYLFFYTLSVMKLIKSRDSMLVVAALFTSLFIVAQISLPEAYLQTLPLFIKKLPQHLGIMFWGAFLYQSTRDNYFDWKSLLLFGFILSPSCVAFYEWAFLDRFDSPPVALSYIFALTLFSGVILSKISHPWSAFFGRISYSVYLNHGIVLPLIIIFNLQLGFLGNMAALIALTTLASWTTYRFIEIPAIRLSKVLAKKAVAAFTPTEEARG